MKNINNEPAWLVLLFLVLSVALCVVLMASFSLNDEFQFEPKELTMAIVVIFFFAVNGLFLRQLYRFTDGTHVRKNIAREFSIAFIAGTSNIILFAFVYYIFGIDAGTGTDKDIIFDIQSSIYFSIVTWTTLGYGDFKPISDLRLIASLEALMGYLYMAILVGLFLGLIKVNTNDNG